MNRLEDKTALITGGSGAIGKAAAELFAQEGARLLLVDLHERELARLERSIGTDRVTCVVADVTNARDTRRYVEAALDRHGRIDAFIANAGIGGGVARPIPEYPIDAVDRVLDVNVRGVFLGLQQVIPAMARSGGGSIVITSSIAGLKGNGLGTSAYVASKHAAVGLMRAAAVECAPLNIRVNTVHPGPIESPMMRGIETAAAPGSEAAARERILATIPMARYGTPEEVARLMLFLASDESRYCTGGVYPVDGGMSAR